MAARIQSASYDLLLCGRQIKRFAVGTGNRYPAPGKGKQRKADDGLYSYPHNVWSIRGQLYSNSTD